MEYARPAESVVRFQTARQPFSSCCYGAPPTAEGSRASAPGSQMRSYARGYPLWFRDFRGSSLPIESSKPPRSRLRRLPRAPPPTNLLKLSRHSDAKQKPQKCPQRASPQESTLFHRAPATAAPRRAQTFPRGQAQPPRLPSSFAMSSSNSWNLGLWWFLKTRELRTPPSFLETLASRAPQKSAGS